MSHPRLPEMQQSSQSPPYSPLEHEVERDFNFLVYALGVGPSQPRAQCLHRRRTQVHFLTHEVATTPSRISEDQQLVQDQVPGSRIPSPMNLEKGLSTRLLHHRSTTTSSNPTTNGNGISFLHKDADGLSSSSTIQGAGGTKGKAKSKKTWSCRDWVFELAAGFCDVDDHESDIRVSEKEEKDTWRCMRW